MTRYGIAEAKDSLSALVDKALAGEEVVITRHGNAAVELCPVRRESPRDPAAIRAATERLIESVRALPPLKTSASELLRQIYEED